MRRYSRYRSACGVFAYPTGRELITSKTESSKTFDINMSKIWSEEQKKMLGTLEKAEKKFEKRHRCMFPGCKEWAISSHSQQRGGQLADIAESGEVIAMNRSVLASIVKSDASTPPPLDLSPVVISKASTFLGFCNNHDTEVFRDIELKPLIKDTPEQVLAFHRRAVAYELWNKSKQVAIESAVAQPFLVDKPELLRADEKFLWGSLWNSDPLFDIEYEWLVLERNIGISLTACIPCLTDLSFDSYMKSFYDPISKEYTTSRPCFTLSICPESDKTHIVMCWRKKDHTNVEHSRRQLIDSKTRATFLNECIFVKSEDYCLRPSLWALLEETQRNQIISHLRIQAPLTDIPRVLSDADVS